MAVSIPAQAISDAKDGAAELWTVVLGIAGNESGYDPRAQKVDNVECSYGYLQMNRCGGLGDGYSPEQLLDGVTNFRLGAEYIRGRLNAGASLYDALQPWQSTRDADIALYNRIQSEGIEGYGSVDGGGSLASGGGSILAILAIAVLALMILD